MKHYIKAGWILLAIVLQFSCKKYLDIKSDASLVVPSTLNDLQGLLDDSRDMNSSGSPSMTASSSDDFFITDDTYHSLSTEQQMLYTWRLKKYNYANDWSLSYIPVYYSNLCLERLAGIKKTPANKTQWDNIKGSALFFRSYSFLNLCWEFGKSYDETTSVTDPGIALRTSTDFNIPSQRASVKESYEKILTDTKEAATLLPDQPGHVMRPSKAAAFGLLARTYLSMRRYDSALKYATLCLQIKGDLMNLNSDPDVENDLSAPVPFKPFNKEMIFYFEMNRNIVLHMYYYGHTDSSLYKSFQLNDLRRTAFFTDDNGYGLFKGSYASSPNVLFTGIATDEIWLIKAECEIRQDQLSEGLNDLNMLLEKRWMTGTFIPDTTSNKNQAIAKVLLERRKELMLRGLRWMDVKRLNKENANITFTRMIAGETFTLLPNDDRWALPLPDDIIKLTGMKQN